MLMLYHNLPSNIVLLNITYSTCQVIYSRENKLGNSNSINLHNKVNHWLVVHKKVASDLLNVVNATQSLTQFALVAVFSVAQSIHDLKPEVLTWIVL